MGYLYDRDREVYIHEALVDENGCYDVAILDEATKVSHVHTAINDRARTGKFDKEESKGLKKEGPSYSGTTNKRTGPDYNSIFTKGISAPNRTQRKHGLKGYIRDNGAWEGSSKSSDENRKSSINRAKKGFVKEDYDYSTEFFSNLELK